ncbi:MAG TPA: hypothetical protein VN673_17035, partial [Clostridia bacterium]|nr:hypothetical protein [Clostridia bacterium]
MNTPHAPSFGRRILWPLLFSVLLTTAPLTAAQQPASVADVIQAAGNAEQERQRFDLLKSLSARADLDPALRADLAKLMPVIDDWANGKDHPVVDHSRAAENGYLCRFIKARPEGQGPMYPPALSEGSPLHPIWAFYRGRMLVWQVIQSGPLLGVKQSRDTYYNEAARLLKEANQAFPKNRVIRMYLGEPIPWPKQYEPCAEAPEWANLQ